MEEFVVAPGSDEYTEIQGGCETYPEGSKKLCPNNDLVLHTRAHKPYKNLNGHQKLL